MTFCPEWLTGNQWLDGSNFVYMWLYLVFFNMLWVVVPLYAAWSAVQDISHAFAVREKVTAPPRERTSSSRKSK